MLDIPIEIYIRFLEFLDYRTLVRCKQVCKTFHTLISESASLVLTIELALAGKIRGDAPIANSDLLNLLRKHQDAWNRLSWGSLLQIKMLRGGLWELYGGVLAQLDADDTFHFTRLPSDLRGIDREDWSVTPTGVDVRDFGIEPSQDLFVLVENPFHQGDEICCQVHLRSMRTGKAHPAAKGHEILSFILSGSPPIFGISFSIQVSGDHLLVQTCLHEGLDNDLLVWNWRTGCQCLHVHNLIRSASLMSNERILIGSTAEDETPCLLVVNFVKETNQRQSIRDLTYVDVFRLPELAPGTTFSAMDVRGEPGPMTASAHDLPVPFRDKTESRVYTIAYWMTKMSHQFSIVQRIPSSCFASIIGQKEAPGHQYATYPWAHWGPKTLLTFSPYSLSRTWVCYVYGQRYVSCESPVDGHFRGRITDLNALAHKDQPPMDSFDTQDDETEQNSDVWSSYAGLTRFPEGAVFVDEVLTDLPVRSKMFEVEEADSHCYPMISEDNIVLVDSIHRVYKVLVF